MAPLQPAIRATALLLIFIGLPHQLAAQSLKSPQFLEGTTKGFDHVYSLDYENARIAFQNLRQQFPQHPGPPLYLALTLWQQELFRRHELQLDRFVSPETFTEAGGQQMTAEDRNAFF